MSFIGAGTQQSHYCRSSAAHSPFHLRARGNTHTHTHTHRRTHTHIHTHTPRLSAFACVPRRRLDSGKERQPDNLPVFIPLSLSLSLSLSLFLSARERE